MSIIRVVKKKGKFLVADAEPFMNKELSWGARGMLAYLLTKPDDWQVNTTELIKSSPAGKAKVQTLINELRDEISKSSLFDDNHKGRLLNRLGSLQNEIHKRMSNLDKFWGFVGDAGVMLGRFGKDAKPFTDRIRDIMQIVWRTQSITEELPSDSPLPMLETEDKDV